MKLLSKFSKCYADHKSIIKRGVMTACLKLTLRVYCCYSNQSCKENYHNLFTNDSRHLFDTIIKSAAATDKEWAVYLLISVHFKGTLKGQIIRKVMG